MPKEPGEPRGENEKKDPNGPVEHWPLETLVTTLKWCDEEIEKAIDNPTILNTGKRQRELKERIEAELERRREREEE